MGILTLVVSVGFMIKVGFELCKISGKGDQEKEKRKTPLLFYSLYSMSMALFSVAYFCGVNMQYIRVIMIVFTGVVAGSEISRCMKRYNK